MNLREKLATIRRELHNIKKSGHNDFHRYDYVTGADTAGMIGNRLAELNVMPANRNLVVGHYTVASAKGPKSITTLQLEYGFLDGESDEQLWYAAYGEGEDATDKGAYKAWTGAQKYWLIQAFMLAMGDDPEFEKDKNDRREPDLRSGPHDGCGVKNVHSLSECLSQKSFDELKELRAQGAGADSVGSPPADPAPAALITPEQCGMVFEQFAMYQEATPDGNTKLPDDAIERFGPVEGWKAADFEKRFGNIKKAVAKAENAKVSF